MKRYRVTIDGRVYDVEVDDPKARPVTARLSGTAYSVDVETTRVTKVSDDTAHDTEAIASEAPPHTESNSTPTPTSVSSDTGPRTMTAPMPGIVSKVTVLLGQVVERGDELLTIEAMKMFNVMRSPTNGTVATVHVKDGDRIVQGQPLISFTG